MKCHVSLGLLLLALLMSSCATQPSLLGNRQTRSELRGMVYDLDRQPVVDATVRWNGGKEPVIATTDIHGRFSLGEIPFESQSFHIEKAGHEAVDWNLKFSEPSQFVYVQIASQDQLFARAADALERKDWKECDALLDRAKAVAPDTLQWLVLKGTELEGEGKAEELLSLLKGAPTEARNLFGKSSK